MANLVQVAAELEYVPKDQLIQMSQNPDSQYPPYLVLSEIQRRTQMEKRYNAEEASMNRPQTTVAEEVVADFAQPQGLGGMNAEGAANAGAFLPETMSETPMQMAAVGGRTGYQSRGATSYLPFSASPINFRNPNPRALLASTLGINTDGMTDEEVEDALLFSNTSQFTANMGSNIDPQTDYPIIGGSSAEVPREVTYGEPEETTSTGLSGARSNMDRILQDIDQRGQEAGSTFGEKVKERYYDEDGDFKFGRAALDASFAIPFGGALGLGARGALKLGQLGLGAYRAGKFGNFGRGAVEIAKRYGNPRTSPLIRSQVIQKPKFLSSQQLGYGSGTSQFGKLARVPGRISTPKIAGLTALYTGGNMLYNYMNEDQVDESVDTDNNITAAVKKDVVPILNDINKGKGLSSFIDQAEGLDIAALGGIIMGAKDMSELGKGIAGLAGSIQDRRTKEKLTEIQGGLYEAQTDKYREDIKFMEPNQLTDMLKSIATFAKIMQEDGDDEALSELTRQYYAIQERLNEISGIPSPPTQADTDDATLAAARL